jgi:hypothetical protein
MDSNYLALIDENIAGGTMAQQQYMLLLSINTAAHVFNMHAQYACSICMLNMHAQYACSICNP